jgi:spermine oxidase
LAWIGGQGAIDMEKLSDEEISKECMTLLRNFLNNPKIPDPSVFYCSRWNSNELIKGAYSFTSRRTDHIDGWEKALSELIISDAQGSMNIIALAGEHCHEKYFSTAHGAFESGIDQARKVMDLRKKLTSKLYSQKL